MILPLSFTNDNLLVMRQVLLWKSALRSLRIVVDQRGRPWNSSNVIHNNFLCSFMLLQRDTLVPRASVSFDHVVGEAEPLVNDISRRVALGTRMAKETKTASIVWQVKTLSTLGHAFRNPHYYTDTGVLLKNKPLVKFIRNCIWDPSSLTFVSSLVKMSMTSFPAFSWLFVFGWLFVYIIKKNISR